MSNKINITLTDRQLSAVYKKIQEYNLDVDLMNDDIENIYKKMDDSDPDNLFYYNDGISLITKLLYSIDIDPLDYLDKIPSDFLNYCDSLVNFVIPDNVMSIGDGAFSGCIGLTSIVIPDSVKSIGDYAFKRCTGLTRIIIPGSILSINQGVFDHCEDLTSVTIGKGVKSINYKAFYNCVKLTSIVIPNSVTSIDYEAFMGCDKLNSINYLGTMSNWNNISIKWNAFPKNLKEIKCKDGVINL